MCVSNNVISINRNTVPCTFCGTAMKRTLQHDDGLPHFCCGGHAVAWYQKNDPKKVISNRQGGGTAA